MHFNLKENTRRRRFRLW